MNPRTELSALTVKESILETLPIVNVLVSVIFFSFNISSRIYCPTNIKKKTP